MKAFAAIGLLLSIFGVVEAFNISHLHFSTEESCPTVAVLPACYVVLICYSAMSLAWLGKLTPKISLLRRYGNHLFWIGFSPAFLLALIGSTGEIFGFVDCPETPGGLPKCFVSLGFVLVLAALWVLPKLRKPVAL